MCVYSRVTQLESWPQSPADERRPLLYLKAFRCAARTNPTLSESNSGSEGTDGSSRRVGVVNVNTTQSERQILSIDSDFRLRTRCRGWQKKRRRDSWYSRTVWRKRDFGHWGCAVHPMWILMEKTTPLSALTKSKRLLHSLIKVLSKLSCVFFWILFNHYFFP